MRSKAMGLLTTLPDVAISLLGACILIEEDYEANGQTGTLAWFKAQRKKLVDYFGEGQPLEQITAEHLRRFRDSQTGKVSASSIQHYKRALSIVFKECIRRRIILENPVTEVKWPNGESKPFSWLEKKRIRKLLKEVAVERDKNIISLLFQTGLRRSELARLRIQDIEPGRNQLTVDGKKRTEKILIGKGVLVILDNLAEDRESGYFLDFESLEKRQDAIDRIFKKWSGKLK